MRSLHYWATVLHRCRNLVFIIEVGYILNSISFCSSGKGARKLHATNTWSSGGVSSMRRLHSWAAPRPQRVQSVQIEMAPRVWLFAIVLSSISEGFPLFSSQKQRKVIVGALSLNGRVALHFVVAYKGAKCQKLWAKYWEIAAIFHLWTEADRCWNELKMFKDCKV